MANQLMFEVGIKQAVENLDKVKKELDQFITDYTKKMQIQVDIKNLETFINALKSIGNGDQLKPLLTQIERLQNRLGAMTDKGRYFDMLRGEAKAAAEEVKNAEKQLETIKKTGNQTFINNAKTNLQEAQKEAARTAEVLSSATERFAKEEAKAASTTSDTKQKIDALSQSVADLHTKIGNGININPSGDFSKWAQEVQTVTASVRELVEQLQKMKTATANASQSTEKLKQAEQAPASKGSLYDQQKFTTLQEAIDKIIGEINRLQQAFTHLGENNSLSNLTTMINGLVVTLSSLSNAIKIQPLDDQVKTLLERCEKAEAKLREVGDAAKYLNERAGEKTQQKASNIMGITDTEAEKLKTVSNTAERFARLLVEIENQMAKIGKIQAFGEQSGFSPTLLKQAQAQLEALRKTVEATIKGTPIAEGLILPASNSQLAQYVQQFGLLKAMYRDIVTEADKLNKSQDRAQKAAQRTADSLQARIDKLHATQMGYINLGINTDSLHNAIQAIRAIKAELENFAKTGTSFYGNSAKEIVHAMGLANANQEANASLKQLNTEKSNAQRINGQLSDSEQRLANAVKGTSDSMRGQTQVLSDLKMMAAQYLSVWGAQSFVGNIIETGGLLEQQRLSLSAILGDMGKAQTLFDQIKTMALKSPFGVVELDKMSKQLAAYSFEYEELFDWTKRLADISAATGTSVDRLALALGHVRSEGALSGYTLRQFAMANVPVLRMLSENLGISSKEVRERVKKKEISAEDVQDILKQLTEDGGMFANAQETMSEALNAKFKNLRDAFDIMYGEIAESGIGDKLKSLAEVLTAGAKHWERLATDVKDVAITFGVAKVAMLMYNNALGKGTALTLKSALAAKQKEIANLQLTASYRQLTTAELSTIANEGKLNATNISTLLSTKKLTYAELERAVALGKVSKAEAMAALNMLGMHKQMALLRQVAPLQGFARVWAIVAYNIKLAGAAVKSFLASAWPLLALTAVFELWNRRSEQKDNANDMSKVMAGNARGREAYEMRDSLADSRKLSDEALKQNIEEMQNALIAANAYTNGLKEQIDATDDLAKKYDLLKVKIGEVADAYEEQKAAQESMMNEAWDAGGGLFSDNMLEDTKQFDTAMAEYQKKLTIASKQIKGVLSEWLRNQGQFKEEFSSMTGKQIFETLTNDMQASFLNYAWNAKGLDNVTSEMVREISRAYSKVGDKLSEMRGEQGEEFASTMKAMYEEAFKVDLDKASNEQKIAFDKWLRETLSRAEGLSNDAKEALRNIVIDFTIKLVPHYQVETPQTAQDVINQQIGDNKWLSGFFGRQNNQNTTDVWTVETAQKEVKKYKKLFGDISLSNLDTAPKKLNSLLDGLEETKKNLQNTLSKGLLSQDEKNAIQTSLNETSESIDLANKALKDVGGKRQKKGGSGNKTDEKLKEWREDLKELQAFWQEYEKLFKRMSSDKAIEEIRKNGVFPSLFDSKGNLLVDVRGGLSKALNALLAKTDASTTERETLQIEIKKLRFNVDQKAAEEAVAITINEMQEYLSKQAGKFDLYKSLLEKTGNKDFAMKAFSDGRVWDELSIEFADELKTAIEDAGQEIDVAELWDMTDAKAKEYLKNVAGGYELWKKIVELTSNKYKKSLEDSANALAKSMTYEQRIAAIRERYKNMGYLGESDDEVYARNRDMNAEIAQVEFDKLKDEINWDAVFGNMRAYTKKALLDARRAIKEYLKLNRQNMGVDQIKDAETAINNLNEAIADKSGLFSGMSENMQEYIKAVEELTKAEKNYQTAVDTYGANSIQAQDARKKVNQARINVDATSSNTKDSTIKMLNKFTTISQSLVSLGKKGGASLSELGGVVGTLIVTLTGTNTVVGNLIAAIFSLLDSLGNDPMGFAENFGKSIGNGLYGVNSLLNPVGNIYKDYHENHKIFGDNWFNDQMVDMYTMAWMKSADWYDYEKIKASYESLLKVWDELLSKKKAYLDKSWGTEAQQAADQAISLLQSEREIAQILGREVLGAGSSMWSHTIDYRMWQGSYDFEGKNWRDVANEISRALGGVKFSEMADMLDMTSEQLIWIKENYTGLWSQMDDDFKGYLEQLIEYGDTEAEILDKVKEKLTGWNTDAIKTEWADLMSSMDNSSDALADNLEEKLRKAILNSMMENLFVNKIQKLIDSATTNDLYLDKNGNVKQHQYDANGNIMDTDVASEFTQEELSELVDQGQGLAEEVTAIRDMLKERYGWTDKDSSSSSSSNTIKGITEQTADLIASYLNAIRADVSVIREMEGKAVLDYWPDQIRLMTSSNDSLVNIEQHTAAIMRSNDTIADKITSLDASITGLKNRTWKMPIA